MATTSGHENVSYDVLVSQMNALHTFAVRYLKYMNQPRDYLTEVDLSITEAQAIALISEEPGMTVTELARLRGSTLSTASLLVGKLERKGFLERRKEDGNAKNIHLYVTARGGALAAAHKSYNTLRMLEINRGPVGQCTAEEIDTFYRVLGMLSEVYRD